MNLNHEIYAAHGCLMYIKPLKLSTNILEYPKVKFENSYTIHLEILNSSLKLR